MSLKLGYLGWRRPANAEFSVRFQEKWGEKGENGMVDLNAENLVRREEK